MKIPIESYDSACTSVDFGVYERCPAAARPTFVAAGRQAGKKVNRRRLESSPRVQLLTAICACTLLICLSLPDLAQGQRGALTVPRNIAELTQQSERIVRGRVMSSSVERHPELKNLWTVVTTLRVEETLKGAPAETLTIRQFIWDVRDHMDGAVFRKGQHVLLLLNKPTQYGLVSTAGIDQGRFLIRRNAQGEEEAVNGAGNAGLLRDLSPELRKRGAKLSPELSQKVSLERAEPLKLNELRELVMEFAGKGKQ